MVRPNGMHHFAISTADMRAQIEFFTTVLGLELVALYRMHGTRDTWHGFVRLNDQSAIAFVQSPEVAATPIEIGRTHAGHMGAPSAPGTLQHVALNVDTEADLLAMRDRIRAHGIHVLGVIEHGFCKSIYFAGPEHLTLEVTTSEGRPIDAQAWVDPQIAAQAGISAADIARYKVHAPFVVPTQSVPQPPLNANGPKLVFAPEIYQLLFSRADEMTRARMSETKPPVNSDPTHSNSTEGTT